MKNIRVLFLVFFISFLFISSCEVPQDNRNVIKVLAYGEPGGREESFLNEVISDFESTHSGYTISYEILYDTPYFNRAVEMVNSNNIPDIYYGGPDVRWGSLWKDNNLQFNHRPYMDETLYDLSLIPDHGPNGEIVNIPLGTTNLCGVMFANEALLTSLGLSLPASYADLVAMVPTAQANGLDLVSFDGADSWAWGACFLSTYVTRFTGDPLFVSKAIAGEKSFTDPGFIQALAAVQTWVDDGVFPNDVLLTDYSTNLRNYSNGDALFVIQGQWVAGDIESTIAAHTQFLPLPAMPGENPAMNGSVAGAMSVGYGMTRIAGDDPVRRELCMDFLDLINSRELATSRLEDGAIVAPIIQDFTPPSSLSSILQKKVVFAHSLALTTGVIDAFLTGDANDAVNTGAQRIAAGDRTPLQVAQEVESLVR